MAIEIEVIDFNGTPVTTNIDRYPDICPVCHHKVTPKTSSKLLSGEGLASGILQILCRCPNRECGMAFFAFYLGVPQRFGEGCWYFFEKCLPGSPMPPEIPESVAKISPAFKTMFTQASNAEFHGWDLVAGPGYRKALEFLVKDFLIARKLGSSLTMQEVGKMSLSKCIDDHIDDSKTKDMAKRAAWLGNDETHYYRRWEDKDINDLKRLIKLTMNALESSILSEEYQQAMP